MEIQFYRCDGCKGVVSNWDIQTIHRCPKCANNKIRPADLTLIEKIVQIMKHPKVWRWGDGQYFLGE